MSTSSMDTAALVALGDWKPDLSGYGYCYICVNETMRLFKERLGADGRCERCQLEQHKLALADAYPVLLAAVSTEHLTPAVPQCKTCPRFSTGENHNGEMRGWCEQTDGLDDAVPLSGTGYCHRHPDAPPQPL